MNFKSDTLKYHLWLNRTTEVCILLFFILFLIALFLYPDRPFSEETHQAISWKHIYWCNLMNDTTDRGLYNPGFVYARFGNISISIGLIVFFLQFSLFIGHSRCNRAIIAVLGVVTMIMTGFIYTSLHDKISVISSLTGAVVALAIMLELRKNNLSKMFYLATVCVALLMVNNIIYHTDIGIIWLPIIQKITIVLVLTWIVGLNQSIREKILELS